MTPPLFALWRRFWRVWGRGGIALPSADGGVDSGAVVGLSGGEKICSLKILSVYSITMPTPSSSITETRRMRYADSSPYISETLCMSMRISPTVASVFPLVGNPISRTISCAIAAASSSLVSLGFGSKLSQSMSNAAAMRFSVSGLGLRRSFSHWPIIEADKSNFSPNCF